MGRPDIEIKVAYVDGECTEYDGQDTSPPPTANIVWATLVVALVSVASREHEFN